MAAIKSLNPKAEVARSTQALAINISAARGLQDVLRTNLGPKGTMKMLVSNVIKNLVLNHINLLVWLMLPTLPVLPTGPLLIMSRLGTLFQLAVLASLNG